MYQSKLLSAVTLHGPGYLLAGTYRMLQRLRTNDHRGDAWFYVQPASEWLLWRLQRIL
jgi:hypothetical protein